MKNPFPLYGRILSALLSVSLALPPSACALRPEAAPEGAIAGELATTLLKLSTGLEEPPARTAEHQYQDFLEKTREALRTYPADVVIGIPFSRELTQTVGNLLEQIEQGLTRFYPKTRFLVLAIGEADSPVEISAVLPNGSPKTAYSSFQKPTGLRGKGWSVRAFIDVSSDKNAHMAYFDADITNITPEWMKITLDPVLSAGSNSCAIPNVERLAHDAEVTNHLIHPLLSAIYGQAPRHPLSGVRAMTADVIHGLSTYLQNLERHEVYSGYGIDLVLTQNLLLNKVRFYEPPLGQLLHTSDRMDQDEGLRKNDIQIFRVLFESVLANSDSWVRLKIPQDGEGIPAPNISTLRKPDELAMTYDRMFRQYFAGDRAAIKKIVGEALFQELEKLHGASPEQLHLSEELWAQLVYRFLLAYAAEPAGSRDAVLQAFFPTFCCRFESFVREVPPDAPAEVVEQIVRRTIDGFLKHRPDFISSWGKRSGVSAGLEESSAEQVKTWLADHIRDRFAKDTRNLFHELPHPDASAAVFSLGSPMDEVIVRLQVAVGVLTVSVGRNADHFPTYSTAFESGVVNNLLKKAEKQFGGSWDPKVTAAETMEKYHFLKTYRWTPPQPPPAAKDETTAGLEETSARTAKSLAEELKNYRGFGFINWRDQADYPANASPDFISQFAQQVLESGLIPKIDIRGIDDALSLQALSQLRTKNQNAVVGVAIYQASQVPSVVSSAQGRNLIISAPVSVIGEVVLETAKTGVNNQILVIAKVRDWADVETAQLTGAQGIEVEPAVGPGITAGETAALLERMAGDAALSHIRVFGSAGGVKTENAAALMAKGYVGFSIGPRTLEPKLQWFNASKQQTQSISGLTPEPGPTAGKEERMRVPLSAETQPPFWLRIAEARKLLTILSERGEPARIGYADPDNPEAALKTIEIRIEKYRILARSDEQGAWWPLPLESRSFFLIHPDRTITFYPVMRQGKELAPAFREARKSAHKLSIRMLNQLLATASQKTLPENIYINEAVQAILQATSGTSPKVTEVVFMQPKGKPSRLKGPHFPEQKIWSQAMSLQQGGWLQLVIDETRQTAVLSPPIENPGSAGQEEALNSGRYVDQIRTVVQKQLLDGLNEWWGFGSLVDFDTGFRRSTTGTILNPHWALVRGAGEAWWIHLHVYYDVIHGLDYYRQHGLPQRVLRNGLLFKLVLSEDGQIQGLSDALAERGDALAPRGFVPISKLIPEKEYRWLIDTAQAIIQPYAEKLEGAIAKQQWKLSLLEAVAPTDAVGIYEMWSSKIASSNIVLRSQDIAITFRRLDPQEAPPSTGLEETTFPVNVLGNRALPAPLTERAGSLNPSEAGDLLLLFVSGEGLVTAFDARPWVGPEPADSYSFPVDQFNPYAYVYNTPDPISISITPAGRELVRGLLQGTYDLHLLVEALRKRFGEDPKAVPAALQGEQIQIMLTTPERFHQLLDQSASGFVRAPDRLFRVKNLSAGTEEVLHQGRIGELEEWLALQIPAWKAKGTTSIRVNFPKGALVNSVDYSLAMGLTAGQVASDIVEVVRNYGAPDILFEVVRTGSSAIELRPAGTEEVEQRWRKYVSALSATTGINLMIQRIRRTQQLEDNTVPPLPDVGLARWEFVLALKQAGFSTKESLFDEFMRRSAEEKLQIADQERGWIWEAIHGAFQGGMEELSFDNALVKILLYIQEKKHAGETPRLQFFNGTDPVSRHGLSGDDLTTQEIREALAEVANLSENGLVTVEIGKGKFIPMEVLSISPAVRRPASGGGLEEPFPLTLKPVPFDNALSKKLAGWLNNTRLQVGTGSLEGQVEATLQHVKKYEEVAASSDLLAFHTFQVGPTPETFARFPWLAVLNKQPPSAAYPNAGSFGQIALSRYKTEEDQLALLIEEVQPSDGYHEINSKHRHQMDGWRRKAVEAIAQAAAVNGYLVFAASAEVIYYANITAPLSSYETQKNYMEPYDPAVWENKILIIEDSGLYRHPSRPTGERLAWHAFKGNPKPHVTGEGFLGVLFGQSFGRSLNNRLFPPSLNDPVLWPVNGIPLPERMQVFWDRYFSENPPLSTETTVDLMLTAVDMAAPFIKQKRVLEIGTGYGYVVSAAVDIAGAGRGVGTDIQGAYLVKGREAVARLGLSDRVTLLEGDLFTPVQGELFDVVFSNTANLDMADRFIQSVETVLAPDGIAFLLPWDNSILGEWAFASPNLDPKRFQKAASRAGLVLQPVITGPGNVKIYAIARDRKRLDLVRKVFEGRAGLEEGLPAQGSVWDQPESGPSYARFAAHPEYGQANQHLVDLLTRNGLGNGQTVVDLGSGTGSGSFLVARALGSTGKVIGVDLSESMAIQAQGRISDSFRGIVEFRAGDALKFRELVPENPNAVVLFNSIHLMGDSSLLAKEVSAKLAPGQLFGFNTTFTKESVPPESMRVYLAIADKAKVSLEKSFPDAPPVSRKRLRTLSQREYRDLIEQAGFAIVEEETRTVPLTTAALRDFVQVPVVADQLLPFDIPLADRQKILSDAVTEAMAELGLQTLPRNWFFLVAKKSAGLEEPVALFSRAQEQADGFRSVSLPDSTWVIVIGQSLAQKFPGLQVLAAVWNNRIVIDRGDPADTITRVAERGDAVHFYGESEEATLFGSMAGRAQLGFIAHDPTGWSFTLLVQEILKVLGVPSEVVSSGLEEFSDDLQALGAAA